MQALSFYIAYPLIWLLSRLPLKVLYGVSDYFLYPILYKLLKYRVKVAKDNLQQVFPEKLEEERLEIEVKFYHFLCDLFVETIKGFTISYETLAKRITFENDEVLQSAFHNSKGGVVVTLGHVGNYEWLAQYYPRLHQLVLAIPYRKLTNPYFDKVFKASRERGGAQLFHTYKTQQYLDTHKHKYILTLANDQFAPADKSYWTRFLNRDTSFFVGTEKMARQKDFPVVFADISVLARGRYHITFKNITDKPNEEEMGFIMQKHTEYLEQNILRAPQYWLWSHKRWKKPMPEGLNYGFAKELL